MPVLEISPRASAETVRAAYKALIQKYHPDRNPGDATAADRASAINAAYDVLSDDERRARYDEALSAAGRPAEPVGSGMEASDTTPHSTREWRVPKHWTDRYVDEELAPLVPAFDDEEIIEQFYVNRLDSRDEGKLTVTNRRLLYQSSNPSKEVMAILLTDVVRLEPFNLMFIPTGLKIHTRSGSHRFTALQRTKLADRISEGMRPGRRG